MLKNFSSKDVDWRNDTQHYFGCQLPHLSQKMAPPHRLSVVEMVQGPGIHAIAFP